MAEVRIYRASHWQAHEREVVLPWLEARGLRLTESTGRHLVITPSREAGFYLKSRLLEVTGGGMGLHFCTPSECRDWLGESVMGGPAWMSRAGAHFFLSMLAEERGAGSMMRSLARDASPLVEAVEAMVRCGHSIGELAVAGEEVAELARAFLAELERHGKLLMWHWDWRQARGDFGVASVLVYGLDGAHWDWWPMVTGVVAAAPEAAVCLVEPRVIGGELDRVWVGSWEQIFGEGELVGGEDGALPFMPLVEAMEAAGAMVRSGAGTSGGGRRGPDFRVGRNLRDEARAIGVQAMHYLAHPGCERLGIVLPGYGALSREVAAWLEAGEIPFHDGLGRCRVEVERKHVWDLWLAFQENPNLKSLLPLLTAGVENEESGAAAPARLARHLLQGFEETHSDRLEVLANWLEASAVDGAAESLDWMNRIVRMPERGTLADYLAITGSVWRKPGWEPELERIAERAREIDFCRGRPVSRAVFLRWLAEVPWFSRRERPAIGNHPYARVQMVGYDQALAQDWTHLILGGLNHHSWPPRQRESPYLEESQIARLNHAAQIAGSHGEGHTAVRSHQALCPGPRDRSVILFRQWLELVSSARSALCLTAACTAETEPDREQVPGEFLTRLYWACRGEPLTTERMHELRRATGQWLEAFPALNTDAPAVPDTAKHARTARAFTLRRDATMPFGEYEFALSSPPKRSLRISCGEWEDAFKDPGTVWMRHILGVEGSACPLDEDRRLLARGVWVHRWLARAMRGETTAVFFPRPSLETLEAGCRLAAERDRVQVEKCFTRSGLTLPVGWRAAWIEARQMALDLAAGLPVDPRWRYAAAEYVIPAELVLAGLAPGPLGLRGRIDLVLTTDLPGSPTDLSGVAEAWVLDYKTGNPPALKAGKLKLGEGIQVAMYALAIDALRADRVRAALVSPRQSPEDFLEAREIKPMAEPWSILARMQNSGVFGMRGELRPEFAPAPNYPLATLPIDPEILEAKWKLTFLA